MKPASPEQQADRERDHRKHDTASWYAFRAYNSMTVYGYGTEQEANYYTDNQLNFNRDINHYAPYLISAGQVKQLDLENNDLGFSLSIAIEDSNDER